MTRKLLKLKIHGQVQGVFFRAETKRKADELGLAGFVRNEPDGTVYVEAQGEEKNLRKFLKWCEHHGPPLAEVIRVEAKYSNVLKNCQDFKILY